LIIDISEHGPTAKEHHSPTRLKIRAFNGSLIIAILVDTERFSGTGSLHVPTINGVNEINNNNDYAFTPLEPTIYQTS
jgi:hypothetical protein